MTTAVAAPAVRRSTGWTNRHTLALAASLAGVGTIGVVVPWAVGPAGDYGTARVASWLATLVLFGSIGVTLGEGLTGDWRGILVDDRNKISLARVQLFLWTAILLSGYLVAVLANVGLGRAQPLVVAVPHTVWAALGVSTASLAAAPFALARNAGTVATNDHVSDATWRDLVSDEIAGYETGIDLGKVQMALATFVLVVAYAVVLGQSLGASQDRMASLPDTSDAFVILLAISHGAYLAKKSAPRLGKPIEVDAD